MVDVCMYLSAGRNAGFHQAEFYIWTMLLGPLSGTDQHGKAIVFPIIYFT